MYYVCRKVLTFVGLLCQKLHILITFLGSYFVFRVNTMCLAGQGFAFKRKEKVRHEYNKILRKEKKKNPMSKMLYKEEYPEHLKHLYLAEAEKLKNESWTNRVNRSKLRMKGQMNIPDMDDVASHTQPPPEGAGDSEQTDSTSGNPEQTEMSEKTGQELR